MRLCDRNGSGNGYRSGDRFSVVVVCMDVDMVRTSSVMVMVVAVVSM